jgi:hypothetical protein
VNAHAGPSSRTVRGLATPQCVLHSMTTYDAAQIRESDTDLVIVVVPSGFGALGRDQQQAEQKRLEACARADGLAGTVVPVWPVGRHRLGALPPAAWQGYFESLTPVLLQRMINTQLSCG